MKIGYLGPKGTFSEEVTSRYFAGQDVQLVPLPTILSVLEEVESGTIDKGVVPIENTLEGAINVTVDSLGENPNLFVQGAVILRVSQHLLGLDDTHLDEIREVWSIPPAIAQCRKFIRTHKVHVKNYDSTAAAASELKKSGRKDVGAIASASAAKQIGLRILAENIHDAEANHTRFVVVTKGEQVPDTAEKTMLLIAPYQEHKGVLANILQIFSGLDLNLTWLESRPSKTRLGVYQFYLDVEAGLQDERISKALSILQILGHSVRTLGSYTTRYLK